MFNCKTLKQIAFSAKISSLKILASFMSLLFVKLEFENAPCSVESQARENQATASSHSWLLCHHVIKSVEIRSKVLSLDRFGQKLMRLQNLLVVQNFEQISADDFCRIAVDKRRANQSNARTWIIKEASSGGFQLYATCLICEREPVSEQVSLWRVNTQMNSINNKNKSNPSIVRENMKIKQDRELEPLSGILLLACCTFSSLWHNQNELTTTRKKELPHLRKNVGTSLLLGEIGRAGWHREEAEQAQLSVLVSVRYAIAPSER